METKEYIDEYGCLVSEFYNIKPRYIFRKIISYSGNLIAMTNYNENGTTQLQLYYTNDTLNPTNITKEEWDVMRNRLLMLKEL